MIYLIPGIGVDHRIFRNINLKGYETTVIIWEHPKKNEPIEDYVNRLSVQVKHASPVFIGLSFGGLIGAELTKFFPGSQLILISSFASRNDLPWYTKITGTLRLNKIYPGKWMKTPNPLIRWFFSVNPGAERKLFDQLLRDSDPDLLAWSLNTILHWKGNGLHRLHHMHGSKDRLLPVTNTSADIIIPDGGHFMIVSHGEKISKLLVDMLTTQLR